MDVTSEEIRSSRFQGTRHVYDRREVDAFLHRAASTLEIYERKLTVTESHVESLEKALELAQSRARSMSGLDGRIAELEAALAAAQHNYESAMSELEARGEFEPSKLGPAKTDHELQAKIEAADAIKAEALQRAQELEQEARATADAAVAAARTEAEEILRTALLAQTSILEEIEEMRLAAEAQVGEKLNELRAAEPHTSEEVSQSDPGTHQVGDRDDLVASRDAALERAAKAKAQLKSANKRASAAEARVGEVEKRLAAVSSAEHEATRIASQSDRADVEDLKRQLAQMRTALANIQDRFSGAAKLSPEELELATALVDLDLHDVDQLVDLTAPAMTGTDDAHAAAAEPETEDEEEGSTVAIKSKWAQAATVPAGALTKSRSEVPSPRGVWPETEKPAPNWRDTFGSARKAAAKAAADSKEEEPLGFYERRLAGLRDRIRDAGGDANR